MRISADENDKGYTPDYVNYDVYLDGVKLKWCITADDHLQAVILNSTEDNGDLVVLNGVLQTEIKRGKVEIIRRPNEIAQKGKIFGGKRG